MRRRQHTSTYTYSSQDPKPQPWWQNRLPLLVLVALIVVIATISGLGYWHRWSWIGLIGPQDNPDTRLGWDWLELLIIPIVLGLAAFWLNQQARGERERARQERENDHQVAADLTREDALQSYLDRISDLILNKKLRESKFGFVIWSKSALR
jgi:hypothetical protein